MLVEVLEGRRRAAGGEVLRGGAKYPAVADQLAADVLARKVVANPDFQVEALGNDVHHPVEHIQAHLQVGVQRAQFSDGRSHMVAAKTEAAADVQHAPRRLARFGQFADEVVQVVEDADRPALGALARLGQGQAPGRAVQQAGTQGFFKDADALADIGRGLSQLIGSTGKTGFADHREEYAEIFGQRRFDT